MELSNIHVLWVSPAFLEQQQGTREETAQSSQMALDTCVQTTKSHILCVA